MSSQAPTVIQDQFGRVDAEGTVYVSTASGERVVGSWQAGSAEEGLAHFKRRYSDMALDISLLETRTDRGKADLTSCAKTAKKLQKSLETATVVGDIDFLAKRLDAIMVIIESRLSEQRKQRQEAAAALKDVLSQAQDLAHNSTDWKSTGDKLRDMGDAWKALAVGVDRKIEAELWRKFTAARDIFGRRRGAHFVALNSERKKAAERKEELIVQAEHLAQSSEWASTASALRKLMTEWKSAGKASRESEPILWERFKAAHDVFAQRRANAAAESTEQYRENQKRKEAILSDIEAIDIASDPLAAQNTVRRVRAAWDAVGPLPREAAKPLEDRWKAVDRSIRDAIDEQRRREMAESNPLLLQMREQVAKAKTQLERVRKEGNTQAINRAQESLNSKQRFLDLAEKAK